MGKMLRQCRNAVVLDDRLQALAAERRSENGLARDVFPHHLAHRADQARSRTIACHEPHDPTGGAASK